MNYLGRSETGRASSASSALMRCRVGGQDLKYKHQEKEREKRKQSGLRRFTRNVNLSEKCSLVTDLMTLKNFTQMEILKTFMKTFFKKIPPKCIILEKVCFLSKSDF